jgi:transitional endoplasmic reticulum ATPase
MVCFYKAISQTFGQLMGASSQGKMGEKIPGRQMTINISATETLDIPVGETQIPGLPISMNIAPQFDVKSDLGGKFVVVFDHARMYTPLIQELDRLAKKMLAENSIFKGKAINSNFEFVNLSGFREERVIYSQAVEKMIEANILQPITRTEEWRKAGSSLKRGILLHGPYGTGKTLTALKTAMECQRHGWTFLNVRPGDDITKSLRVAKYYAPCVVFFEDIDRDASGSRTHDLDQILNTIDGVVGKGDEVMTVMTTNHIENISPAMLRPGRLDAVIACGDLDAYAIKRMLEVTAQDTYGESMLTGHLDMDTIMRISDGYTAAFVVEAVQKAKAYALARTESGNKWSISNDDIVAALSELRPQYELMKGNVVQAVHTIDDRFKELISEVIEDTTGIREEE